MVSTHLPSGKLKAPALILFLSSYCSRLVNAAQSFVYFTGYYPGLNSSVHYRRIPSDNQSSLHVIQFLCKGTANIPNHSVFLTIYCAWTTNYFLFIEISPNLSEIIEIICTIEKKVVPLQPILEKLRFFLAAMVESVDTKDFDKTFWFICVNENGQIRIL